MSAMAFNTVSMVKFQIENHLFLDQSMAIYKDIQVLGLTTVKERENEYVRRVNMLPNHYRPSNDNSQNNEATETNNSVRVTFFKKTSSILTDSMKYNKSFASCV